MEIERVSEFEWEFCGGKCKVFASEELMEKIKEDGSLAQVENVSRLPGIVGQSMAMPDIHLGYGFSIGGVAAFDLDKGVVCPGGVGYDINCGVRLLKTSLKEEDLKGREKEIVELLSRSVPSGVGSKSRGMEVGGRKLGLSVEELDEVLKEGARWAVRKGYGKEEDLDFIEDGGCLDGRPEAVFDEAKKRGRNQLGTLGAGNHFLDVLVVDEVFDLEVAKVFGLRRGQVVIMIHCGSRGLGHQVAGDYIRLMSNVDGSNLKNLDGSQSKIVDGSASLEGSSFGDGGLVNDKDRIDFVKVGLVNAPIKSELGEKYLGAMRAAANFAFANRQIISHLVFETLKNCFEDLEVELVYDICHNIAKIEDFSNVEVAGCRLPVAGKVLVVRKGATRAFGPGREEVALKYRSVGQPVLLPGSMGTASYVLAGTSEAQKKSFGSSSHGAGRVRSRTEAYKVLDFDEACKRMEERGVFVKARGQKGMVEEAPESYKDISEVVRVLEGAGLGKKVVRLRPKLVVIG